MTSPRRPDHPDVDALWRDLHDPLLGFIARRVPDRATAEDILQEVMLRIHRHAGDQPRAQAVGAWVHQITRNAISDHYRRAVVRRERPTNSQLTRHFSLTGGARSAHGSAGAGRAR